MAAAPTLADRVFQIAYVVPDLHAAIAFFKDKMGVDKFVAHENICLADQVYNGKPGDYRQSIAFGFCGEMQIELIQPLSGTSSYSDYLAKNPQGGVQHLGILVEDYDAGVAEMKGRGFTLVQTGRNGDTRFAYFDSGESLGTLTEVVYLAPPERAGYEKMKRREG